MNNLFEGAKNGDKFLCRDGGKATFIEIVHSDDFGKDFARLYDETTQKREAEQRLSLVTIPNAITSALNQTRSIIMNRWNGSS